MQHVCHAQAPSLPTSEAVRTLCGHSSGAKLAAMAMSALGLRPSGTIHLPGTFERLEPATALLAPVLIKLCGLQACKEQW